MPKLRSRRRSPIRPILEPLEVRCLLSASLTVTDSSGSPSDESVTMDDTAVGTTSNFQTFTLTNNGDSDLDVTNLVSSDDQVFTVSAATNTLTVINPVTTFSIPAGLAYSVFVLFTPTETGPASATITFNTNDPNNASVTLSAAGTGTATTAAPKDPSNLQAAATSPTSVDLSWTDNSLNESGFNVLDEIGSAGFQTASTLPANSTSTTIDNLTPGQHYTFEVTASNSIGTDDSPPTAQVSTPVPVTQSGPSLSITDSSGSATDQSITLDDTDIGSTSASQTFTLTNDGDATLNITNFASGNAAVFPAQVQDNNSANISPDTSFSIPSGQVYTIFVEFAPTDLGAANGTITFDTNDPNNASVTLSAAGAATTTTAPADPSDFTATAESSTSINLSWTDNSNNESEFDIMESVGQAGFQQVSTLPANTTTTTIDNLTPGQLYFFEVSASNSVGADSTPPQAQLTMPQGPDPAGPTLDTAKNLGKLYRTTTSDSLSNSTSDHLYVFKVPAKGVIRAVLSGLSANASLDLFNIIGNGTIHYFSRSRRPGNDTEIISKSLNQGLYYLRVSQATPGVSTSYSLAVSGDYAGNTFKKALPIVHKNKKSVAYHGSVDTVNAFDFYSFTLDARQKVSLLLSQLSADADLYLYDDKQKLVAKSTSGGSANKTIARKLSRGLYFVRITNSGTGTSYKLTATFD